MRVRSAKGGKLSLTMQPYNNPGFVTTALNSDARAPEASSQHPRGPLSMETPLPPPAPQQEPTSGAAPGAASVNR